MNKIKRRFINIFLILMVFFNSTIIVNADSGLDSSYKDSSIVGVLLEAIFNSLSFIIKLVTTKPNEEDYSNCHIITLIICLIFIYIFTNINIFKLDKRKKISKEVIKLLLISLIPVFIFSIICLLTKFYLIIYFLITIIYIIIFMIVIKNIIKNKISSQLNEVKNIDKKFNIDEFNNKAFDIYKRVQIAWSLFKLNDIKDIISDNLYKTYEDKLSELKNNNQKNVMDEIEFKSNNIVYINVEDNTEKVICEMNVSCYDYIINNEEKVIKGEKDKKYDYTYRLSFSKNLKDNKLILEDKKLLKTKVINVLSKKKR